MNRLLTTCVLGGWLLAVSCAPGLHRQGLSRLEDQQYNEAISLLQQAEVEHPNNAAIKRDLGVALYRARRFDDALEKLKQAKSLDSKDSKTVFYLGLTYERKDMLSKAIDEYRGYKDLSRSGGFRKEISKRIAQLTSEQISRDISQALATEESMRAEDIPENTVAVLYFRNLSQTDELNPLQKGLAQMMITDLSKVQTLQVLERLKLQRLLEELQLGQSGLVDETTAPRVGKLLGTQKLVAGGFTELSEDDLRIDASLTETTTTVTSRVDEVTGKLNAFFQMEKQLVFKVIDELGITLTPEERKEIQKIPTENMLAFLAYSKGLDFEDRGLYDQARQQYQRAIELDPNFEIAKQNLEEVDVVESAAKEPKAAPAELETEFEELETEVQTSNTESRLFVTTTAVQTGQTPQGDTDTRQPVQETNGLDRVNPSTATVPLRIPLPDNQ